MRCEGSEVWKLSGLKLTEVVADAASVWQLSGLKLTEVVADAAEHFFAGKNVGAL